MQIEITVSFRCACGLAVSLPTRAGPCQGLPMKIGAKIERLPEGWQLGPQGSVHCPAHPPRLVQPVTVMPPFAREQRG